MIHIEFCALHQINDKLTEIVIAVTTMIYFKKNNIKELLYNFGIFISFMFVTELLKSFSKIMIISD